MAIRHNNSINSINNTPPTKTPNHHPTHLDGVRHAIVERPALKLPAKLAIKRECRVDKHGFDQGGRRRRDRVAGVGAPGRIPALDQVLADQGGGARGQRRRHRGAFRRTGRARLAAICRKDRLANRHQVRFVAVVCVGGGPREG